MIFFGIALITFGILFLYTADVDSAASAANATLNTLDPILFKNTLLLFEEKIKSINNIERILSFVEKVGSIDKQAEKIPLMLEIIPKLTEHEKILTWKYISGIHTHLWIAENPGATFSEIKAYFSETSENIGIEITQSLSKITSATVQTRPSLIVVTILIGVSLAAQIPA